MAKKDGVTKDGGVLPIKSSVEPSMFISPIARRVHKQSQDGLTLDATICGAKADINAKYISGIVILYHCG